MLSLSKNQLISTTILLFSLFVLSCTSSKMMHSMEKESVALIPLYRPAKEVPEYRIGIGDKLEVKFFDNDKFNETVIVRPDGRISLQRINEIYVNGMTPSTLDSMVTHVYSKIIKQPDVTIFVRKSSRSQVYLMGEVEIPGAYPMQNGLTLLQALAMARWETEDADLKSVVLMRRTNQNTMSARTINVKDLTTPANPRNDIVLQADDVIFVPRTFIANLGKFIRSYYDILLPPWQAFWQIQYIEARINN